MLSQLANPECRIPEMEITNFPIKPDGRASIWRYLDLPRFLSLVSTRRLFLPSVTTLQRIDPFEGTLSEAEINEQKEFFKRFLQWTNEEENGSDDDLRRGLLDYNASFKSMQENLEFIAAWTFISCWHAKSNECDLMWKSYGAMIAIKSTVEALEAELSSGLKLFCNARPPNEPELNVGFVRYMNFAKERIPSYSFGSYFCKRENFASENEIRAVISAVPYVADPSGRHMFAGIEPSKFELDRNKQSLPGLSISVNLENLIQEVVVSPAAPQWFYETLLASLSQMQIGTIASRVSHSVLKKIPPLLFDEACPPFA
jgi:hypothetical protein